MATCRQCGASMPPHARFCPACGTPADSHQPSDERKVATVLFADLVGSTELGAQDPERTRALLDRFYDAMADEIAGAGGTLEKFVGDAVMAAFGAPAALEDHAERSLHAALSMRRRLGELFGDALSLRIGINTGEVVVGRPREGSSFVTGDSVNVAARLEQAAAPNEILVGQRTVSAVRGAFEFARPVTVEAKGKPEGVVCRRLLRALSLMRPRGVSGLLRAFVGRESEMDVLRATYQRAVRGAEPHLVTIMGDAGVGKTRLVRELWEWLGSQTPEPLRRTGRSLPYGRGLTYWPLGEILKEHLGLLESDPPETVRHRLGAREILGLTLGMDVAGDLHPLVARDRLHQAWVDFFQELTAEQPTAVLIEDLNWAEEPLLDLLEQLLRDIRGPLLLIATSRPELLDRRPTWSGGRRNASTLWLEPLSLEDSADLLGELIGAEIPAQVQAIVTGRAEGNPFFVEELIGTLIDQGLLERVGHMWSFREMPSDFVVPDSIQALVAARIDRLQPPEKAALQAASVIGRIFWPGPVSELLEGASPDFEALEDRDFVRRRSGSSMEGEREFAFKHALTREVAYGTLPKAKRARLHARFAGWLERFGEGRDEHASFLAHHYAEAVRPEDVDLVWPGEPDEVERLRAKAAAWLRRAAELAVGRYEIDDALELLHRAVDLEGDERARGQLWRAIGRANALKYDGEAFWKALQKALELSMDPRDRADLYSELALQTADRWGMWKRRPEDTLVEGWIDRALELAEPGSPALARALIARVYRHPDRPELTEAAREASAIAEGLGDVELRSLALAAHCELALAAGEYDDAASWAERRLELMDRISDPDHHALAYTSLLFPHLGRGRMEEARRCARLHDEVASKLSLHHRVHGAGVILLVEDLAGRWESIRELTPRTEQVVQANLDTPCIMNPRSLLICALATAHLGDKDGARRLESGAEAVWMEGYGPTLDYLRVRFAILRGDLQAVERLLADSMAADRLAGDIRFLSARLDGLAAMDDADRVEVEAPPLIRPNTYLEAFALRALGLVRRDAGLIETAAARFDGLGLDWHAAQTREWLARRSRGEGNAATGWS